MICGRPARLTAEQAAELRRRYELYQANRPVVLKRDYGLTDVMVYRYAMGKIKRYA